MAIPAPALAAGKAERAQWKKTRVYVQGDSLTVGAASPPPPVAVGAHNEAEGDESGAQGGGCRHRG